MFFFHVLKLLKAAEEGSELVLSEQSMGGSFSRISLKKGKFHQKDSSEFFPVFQGILQRMRKERHILCFSLRIEDLASGRDVVLFRDVREIPENFSLWVENVSSGGKIPPCRMYLEVGYFPAEKLVSKAPKGWQLAYQWALEVSGKIAALVSSPEGYGIWDGENLSQVS